MKIKCLKNSGEDLRQYEYSDLTREVFGRFGVSAVSEYDELKIGQEYVVMGIIVFETYIGYIIDDNNIISVYPSPLFEVTDNKVYPNWHFRPISVTENIYPYVQAIWGYEELCVDKMSYEKLIMENDYDSQKIYFERKKELT